MTYSYLFNIADINIKLDSDKSLDITDHFLPFISHDSPDYKVCFHKASESEIQRQKRTYLHEEDCFSILDKEDGDIEVREFYPDLDHREKVYAIGSYDLKHHKVSIRYLEAGRSHLNQSDNCFYHIALEKMLLQERRMILHSCCVVSDYGGICFSGDSGIGKSTQGDLWMRYKHADIINGDRTILYKREGRWLGAGSPYAGSSRVYKNEKVAMRAIVMLQQSRENKIRRLKSGEAFLRIYRQITVNGWDRDFVNQVITMIEELIADLPVYELSCTPDERAVNLLDSTFKEDMDI